MTSTSPPPRRPWYTLSNFRWGWGVFFLVGVTLVIANCWSRDESVFDSVGEVNGPALGICGFPQPAVLVIQQRDGLHRTSGDWTEHTTFYHQYYTGTYDFHMRPGASAPVTFADDSTMKLYDGGALALDVGVFLTALAVTFGLCAWLSRFIGRSRGL